ncbi:MAG: hypothetical protein JSW20_14810 [Nitrospiraceae bacterium]|nr:MAG: hypothetical protein JSW20_14810 [Nitrospiraceae bacterium]
MPEGVPAVLTGDGMVDAPHKGIVSEKKVCYYCLWLLISFDVSIPYTLHNYGQNVTAL